MSDPHVREIGRVKGMHGAPVIVGVDRGSVTLDTDGACLDAGRAEEFAQLFVRACWEAARQDGAP